MVSFHLSKLITAAKKTNETKSELMTMGNKKFDGNVHYYYFYDDKNLLSNHVICFPFFNYTSAHQVDNPPSVAMGCVLGTEGMFVI